MIALPKWDKIQEQAYQDYNKIIKERRQKYLNKLKTDKWKTANSKKNTSTT